VFPLEGLIIECCVSRLYLLAIAIIINITKVLEESADTVAVGLEVQAENTKVCRLNENIHEVYIVCHLFCSSDYKNVY
jgi:hypothetical protein